MKTPTLFAAAAFLASVSFAGLASAQGVVATTDLNVRAGPGPGYPVITTIPANGEVSVHGCMSGGNWCDVTAGADRGWVYAAYLSGVANPPAVEFQTRTYWDENYRDRDFYARRDDFDGPLAGVAGGALAGAIVGGPIGAVVGGIAGGAAGAALDPPAEVRTYVDANEVDPVYLDGEVVVGANLPAEVRLYEVPGYEYRYARINGQAVLVDPADARIVYIYR